MKYPVAAALFLLNTCNFSSTSRAGDSAQTPAPAPADSSGAARVMSPQERIGTTEKGKLRNPIETTPAIIEDGKALYQAKTCGACHGPNGYGIHCPSLINDAWIYSGDDDTIFRLVTLGSEKLATLGYSRGDKEKHAGPMPGFSEAFTDERDLWKIMVFIRSLSGQNAKP